MKAQSAMEYLMTYGWSILIIAVVIASLIELGVFNSSSTSTSACIGTTGYSCTNPTLYASGALITKLGQIGTGSITITGTACTRNSTVTTITPVSNTTLQSEQQQSIIFHCPLTANATGTQFTGHLWIEYTTASQQNIIQEVGSVVTPIVNSNTSAYAPIIYIADKPAIYECPLGGCNFPNVPYTDNTIAINPNNLDVINNYVNLIPQSSGFGYDPITYSGGNLFMLNGGPFGPDNVIEVNSSTGSIIAIMSSLTFNSPTAIAVSGQNLYVLNSNAITIFDTGNGQYLGSITSPYLTTTGRGLAISGTTVYITNRYGGSGTGTGNVIELDTNGQYLTSIDSPYFAGPYGIAVANPYIYVVNSGVHCVGGSCVGSCTANILEFSATNSQLLGAIDSPAFDDSCAQSTAIDLSGSTAYLLNEAGYNQYNDVNAGNVIIINLNSNKVIGSIETNAIFNPSGMAISNPITP